MADHRMPAEWEPHRRCWMLWPVRTDNWRCGAGPAQRAFAQVAAAIAMFEPVVVGALPAVAGAAQRTIDQAVADRGDAVRHTVTVAPIEYNDAWMRDIGPTFVVARRSGAVVGLHWRFNAWGGADGGCYSDWSLDVAVPRAVCALADARRIEVPMVMEGGSFHVDGEGTLLTTRECLLHRNRNPSMRADEIEALLKRSLGVVKVIWLDRGVYGDEDTNGHIDNLCFFARPGVVVLTWTDDEQDPQYAQSAAALAVLERATDARGRRLQVVKLHQPDPLYITAEEARGVMVAEGEAMPRTVGTRMPASYANCLVANGGVIVPLFGDEHHDRKAIATLEAVFPERRVVGVASREILLGGGNIHCITQQEPAPRARATM